MPQNEARPAPFQAVLHEALAHGISPGLERITALLQRLGNPQESLRVIHVAGTNGKGSVCAMLTAILTQAGLRIGRYTSPHLIDYPERFWFDGQFIPRGDLDARLARVSEAARSLDPSLGPVTEFELLTTVAFDWFADGRPDLVLLEVGLGGRLDATNVVAQPEVCVITRIARDHTQLLGDTLEAIAREKAGILKRGVPALVGAVEPAWNAIQAIADQVGAPLERSPAPKSVPSARGHRVLLGPHAYELGLLGPHQAENAALAVGVVELLRRRGYRISEAAVAVGLAGAHWPGRMDRWVTPDGERFCMDGAHNVDGVAALVTALRALEDPSGRILVAGMLADKDYTAMVAPLAACFDTLVLTAPPSPRGLDPARLSAEIEHADCRVVPDWQEALALARRLAQGREIVVAGSLYLVGAAYGALGRAVAP